MNEGIAYVFVIIGALALAYTISSYGCHSRWEGSGHDVSFQLGAGCRVYVDGQWIPEKNYRNVGD